MNGEAISPDEIDNGVVEQPPVMSVGRQLREAREAKGLSQAEIAAKLKLSTHQVQALEADDWSHLPWNTIIRGFVRNYARVLGLDTVDLMASLDGLQMPQNREIEIPVGTRVPLLFEGHVERRDYFRVISGVVLLILALLAYFYFPQEWRESTLAAMQSLSQSFENTSGHVESPVSRPQTSEAAVVPPAPAIVSPVEVAVAVPTPPQVTVPEAQPDSPAPIALAPTPPVVSATKSVVKEGLKFGFTEPSWVEVRDRNGDIIFSQLNPAGSQSEVTGKPPFTLVIGNASRVTLLYKGKNVDLSKRSKDDVVRLTLE